jgi:hypothetical protein
MTQNLRSYSEILRRFPVAGKALLVNVFDIPRWAPWRALTTACGRLVSPPRLKVAKYV